MGPLENTGYRQMGSLHVLVRQTASRVYPTRLITCPQISKHILRLATVHTTVHARMICEWQYFVRVSVKDGACTPDLISALTGGT